MEYKTKTRLGFLDKVIYDTTRMEQALSIMIYSTIGFFIPFVLSHSSQQLIVGSIVNMMIIMSAFHLKRWEAMPLILLPTIGVISAGVLFGKFTMSLVYMMPFIWAGNFILFAGVKKLYVEKKLNYAVSLPISILVKTGVLFSAAFVMVKLSVLPQIFLTAMGIVQIMTALIGAALAFSFLKGRALMMKN